MEFNSSLVVVLLVLISSTSLCLSYPTFGSKVSNATLNDLCAKTISPVFCLATLGSNPKTAAADMKGLCEIAMENTMDKAVTTAQGLVNLIPRTEDPILRKRYTLCYANYNDFIGMLYQVEDKFKAGDYAAVSSLALNMEETINTCERLFGPPPPDFSGLSNRNHETISYVDIVKTIANRL